MYSFCPACMSGIGSASRPCGQNGIWYGGESPYHAASMAAEEAPASESWSIDRDSEVFRKASLSTTTIHFSQQDKRQDDILLFFDC
jgi:hypothetical protein